MQVSRGQVAPVEQGKFGDICEWESRLRMPDEKKVGVLLSKLASCRAAPPTPVAQRDSA